MYYWNRRRFGDTKNEKGNHSKARSEREGVTAEWIGKRAQLPVLEEFGGRFAVEVREIAKER